MNTYNETNECVRQIVSANDENFYSNDKIGLSGPQKYLPRKGKDRAKF